MQFNESNAYPKCTFCQILVDKSMILYEDESFFIIKDRKPVSELHLLAIPTAHIRDINHLKYYHKDLLLQMKEESIKFVIESLEFKNEF